MDNSKTRREADTQSPNFLGNRVKALVNAARAIVERKTSTREAIQRATGTDKTGTAQTETNEKVTGVLKPKAPQGLRKAIREEKAAKRNARMERTTPSDRHPTTDTQTPKRTPAEKNTAPAEPPAAKTEEVAKQLPTISSMDGKVVIQVTREEKIFKLSFTGGAKKIALEPSTVSHIENLTYGTVQEAQIDAGKIIENYERAEKM